MKKLTLFLVATLFSALSFAALNPYAYGLKSKLSDDEKTVTITYKLNAPATAVSVVVLDGETVLKTQSSTGITQGEHSVAISTDGFPKGKTLKWKVEVKGAAVSSFTMHDVKYNAYHPSSVDIDNNPESVHFGRILCNESMQKVKGLTKASDAATNGKNYLGTENGAGIFEFNAAFEYVDGYNGGKTFPTNRYGVTGTASANQAYVPRRIRISDDGRIFVTSLNSEGDVLWELNPDNLNEWTTVIADGTRSTKTNETRNIIDGSGNFIAGPNVGFDVHGSGENLKLVMLSSADEGWSFTQSAFKCVEYKLGTAKTWNKQPSKIIFNNLALYPLQAQVQYDKDGGVWFTQYNSATNNTTKPGLAHWNVNNTNQTPDNIIARNNTRNAGFRYNNDYTKVIIANNSGNASIYDVTLDQNGVPQLSNEVAVNMTAMGSNLNDFAWDYADNIYVVSNSKEFVAVYPSPHSADKVVATPCASKYAFSLPAPPQLNPFAYKLSSELSADEKTLTINYSLNALATSVNWVLMDGETPIKTVDLSTLGLEKGDYTTTISTTDFPQYKQLTWKIEVKGVAVNEPTEYSVNHSFYHPSSVDIDNNPENETFGMLLVNEGMHEVKTKTTHADGSTYVSSGFGAGIFAFNPAFENTGKYNGGITFTNTRADGSGTAYSPRRIRISDDGRIFVTSLNTDGNYLWEVNPENLNEWTPVFKGTLDANKELVDAGSNFVAAPNVGFDVRGEGANLKLLMLSSNLRGFPSTYAVAAFKCNEYNLGTNPTWNSAPSKTILSGKYMINYTGDQVAYDDEGGVWFCQHQGTAKDDFPSLVHINKNGVEDHKEIVNNRMAGGIRFNEDFTKVIIAGIADGTQKSKKATLYKVSKNASGAPVLTEELVIDMAIVGNNLNDFAWDYAGNLYACGNSNEKLAVWAMPHSSEDVVATPAASKYAFSIGKYTVTVNTNDVNKGTVTGGGEYGAGAVVTLTATPKEGYELLYWSDRSKENPRNITVDGNEALSAYFIKKNDVEPTFSITQVWENTNVPTTTADGYQAVGWDQKIYMQNKTAGKIITYSSAEDTGTDYATSGSGQQIALDEAGNLIVFNAYFATSTPAKILIYKKGSTTGTEVSFTLQQAGQCHFFSASGDIYSAEGGYVYFYCQNKTAVNRVKIKNGAATPAADVTVDVVGDEIFAGNTQNHVMEDIFGNLVAVSRSNAASWINVHTNESSKTFATTLSGIKLSTLGGCTFELAGKEFWAFNVGSTHYNSEWNLYNLTDKKFESSENLYTKNKTDKNSAANWLNVQVVDEKTAYIYQFCPAVGAAVWKVTRDHIVTATAVNGTVTGAGTYKDNATATLTATPNDGYVFKNWTKNGVVESTENPYSFTVTEDVELVANFDGPFCELILNTNDEAKGTVSGAGLYRPGQTATIKATPKPGYKLLYWSDRSTQATRTITMNKKEALSAYFVKVYDEEPTFAIEKVWENTNVPGSANNGFQAVGWDQRIYMKDRLNAVINVYTETSSELYAQLGSAVTNLAGDQPIAVDDAGNLIVRSGSGEFHKSPIQVTILKKGETTGKTIDFTLPATGRCDFISASGDIYSTEGGYVYFYCMGQTTVSRLYIKNGGAGAADISVDEVGATLTEGSSQSHVFTNIFGDLMTHTRDNNYKVLQEVNVATGAAITMNLPNFKNSTLGGCSFELGGKELIAYNIKGTDYNSEWNLYNMTDKEFVSNETLYAKDRISRKNSGAANWLNVQVVDEKTAYIYQFCPEVAVAVWKVTCTTEKTVTIDENADNTTALENYDGDVVTATVTRSFGPNKYLTLTLPFDMNAKQIRNVFGNATVYALYNVVKYNAEEVHLQFSPVSTITAGTPYILATAASGYDAEDGFTIEGVAIDLSLKPVTPASGDVTMVPVLDAGGTLNKSDEYFLSNNALYCAETYPRDIMGLRAYFKSASPLPIRARVVFQDNAATSIPMVETQPANQVRKVLKDGQLIIIRGEEMYNIQGQRME